MVLQATQMKNYLPEMVFLLQLHMAPMDNTMILPFGIGFFSSHKV